MKILPLILTACSFLLLSACSDENVLSEDVVESHFNIPCERLRVTRSTFNVDLNVLVIDLAAAPQAEFYEALTARGWKPVEHREGCYVYGRMSLSFDCQDNSLVIKQLKFVL